MIIQDACSVALADRVLCSVVLEVEFRVEVLAEKFHAYLKLIQLFCCLFTFQVFHARLDVIAWN